MTKISTLFYILDNSNNENNIEIAGKALNYEFADVIKTIKSKTVAAPEKLVNKVLQLSQKS